MSVELAEKTCTKCGETKPLSQFYRDRYKSDGRHSFCVPCQKAAVAAYQARKRAELGDEAWKAKVREDVARSRASREHAREKVYSRAQWRALAELRDRHRVEYERLLALQLDAVEREEAAS